MIAYGVEEMVVPDKEKSDVLKICTGGRVNIVGPSTVLTFALGIVELWLLLKSGSDSPSYRLFSTQMSVLFAII